MHHLDQNRSLAGAKLTLAANLGRIGNVLGDILGPHLMADSEVWGSYGWLDFVLGTPGIRIAGGTDEVLPQRDCRAGPGAAPLTD